MNTELMDKKYDHSKAEAAAQELWRSEDTYSAKNNPGPLYSIDTPPPTVSGSLHIGHIFSYTQTDIIARYTRMQGMSVFYPFGFDDNGLPTEKFVEKKRDIQAHNFKRSEFIDICLKETVTVEKQFEALWRRIGLSVDWNACYSTIDERSRYISQLSFIELYKKGHVYRKDEPALYCTNCRTTVAQAELDDLEKGSQFVDLIFTSGSEKLLIATTRPELLFAVNAVFYHPEDKRYLHLAGKQAMVPFYNTEVPILPDPLVDPEKGTGLVMSSTFGDKTDVGWFKKHNLAYKPAIGLDGKFTPETGPIAGLRAHAAREKIIEVLEAQGLVTAKKAITHSVNVHERCKKEIEYLILPQWFLAILPHKQKFIELGNAIEWYPSFMKSRYANWVENISWDWCLSRQRFYGIPFPAWHCTHCKAILVADEKQLPIDPQEVPYDGTCACGSTEFTPDTDVMDTWNTSSLTPYICASLYSGKKELVFEQPKEAGFIPMSMRPQAHDIIRTWAFDTIIKVWMHNDTIPWNKIVISGHVLSTEKEKISKSKGNSPLDPENLLSLYPADAIRYWTASGSLGYDISFSENQIGIGQKLLIKLWNAMRFAQPSIEGIKPGGAIPSKLGIENEWLLSAISRCFTNYAKYFEQHEFSLALGAIEQFFWQDFCDNYLEIIKEQLMHPEQYSEEEVAATKWTLATVSLRILQLYAPFIPHATETLYGLLFKQHVGIPSIHQTKFADIQYIVTFEQSERTMKEILAVLGAVRKLKTEKQLSLRTELASLAISSSQGTILSELQTHEKLIKGITRAHSISWESKESANELQGSETAWHATIQL
jgi:valyl-tRNA synthetase